MLLAFYVPTHDSLRCKGAQMQASFVRWPFVGRGFMNCMQMVYARGKGRYCKRGLGGLSPASSVVQIGMMGALLC